MVFLEEEAAKGGRRSLVGEGKEIREREKPKVSCDVCCALQLDVFCDWQARQKSPFINIYLSIYIYI